VSAPDKPEPTQAAIYSLAFTCDGCGQRWLLTVAHADVDPFAEHADVAAASAKVRNLADFEIDRAEAFVAAIKQARQDGRDEALAEIAPGGQVGQ